MKTTVSYKVRIIGMNRIFQPTAHIYQKAVAFLVPVVNEHWDDISEISYTNAKMLEIEKLVHTTKNHKAVYAFDDIFPKMPTYMRRAATFEAIGLVSNYRSNYANWEKSGSKKKPPRLGTHTSKAPVFYRGGCFKENKDDNTSCSLKLFVNNDWIWVDIHLRKQDVKYIDTHMKVSPSAPRLELKKGKAYLVFSFEEKVTLSKDPRIAVGVDLGLNSDAVMCSMTPDGTVLARKFINFKSEKDRIWHLQRIARKIQKKSGRRSTKNVWSYIDILSSGHEDKIARAIVEFAVYVNADVIVFEHLDMKDKKRMGKWSQRVAMWRKNSIQQCAASKAHCLGIHVSHVNAWNTSRLAYDGSGAVKRNEDNHALCTFSTGKRYNCDLSASYNIAARYFIRYLLKTLPETVTSRIAAKVPDCANRTKCTLSTLISLNVELKQLTA